MKSENSKDLPITGVILGEKTMVERLLQNMPTKVIIEKEDFFHIIWKSVDALVRYNRGNEFMQKMVRKYPDLTPRLYVTLTIMYGAFSSENSTDSLLRDAVGILCRELEEKESAAVEYSKNAHSYSRHYPGLHELWEKINDVYAKDKSGLPPTPHQAYALLTLNCPSATKLFGQELREYLMNIHNTMDTLITTSYLSQHEVTKH